MALKSSFSMKLDGKWHYVEELCINHNISPTNNYPSYFVILQVYKLLGPPAPLPVTLIFSSLNEVIGYCLEANIPVKVDATNAFVTL